MQMNVQNGSSCGIRLWRDASTSGCTSNRTTIFVILALGLSTNYAKQNRDRFAGRDAVAKTARLLLRN